MACFSPCFHSAKLSRQHKLERVAAINTTAPEQEALQGQQNDLHHRTNSTIINPLTHANHPKKQAHLIPRFTWDEIHKYTSNFSSVLGSGGFSTVYLAQFSDSAPTTSTNAFGLGAVKIQCGSTQRLNQIYKQELQILRDLQHDHIVKLLGYCDDREEGVLVFEYVPNGNLQEKLHPPPPPRGSQGGDSHSLSWRSRVGIAFQLAQALEYLHHRCPLQIIHGDIKASNILLDQQLNCKLCDFGSAKMGFSWAVESASSPSPSSYSSHKNRMMMLGSPGYTDPHYLWTGIASKKNDIYSFGVILVELITGMEALHPVSGERLTSIAGPMLRDPSNSKGVAQMVDPRLRILGFNLEDLEEVKAMASIAAMCLGDCPSLRPSASDILNFMRSNIPSTSTLSFSLPNNKKKDSNF